MKNTLSNILLLCALSCTCNSYAQSVTGRTVSSSGEPIPSVVVTNNNTFATTNGEGRFELNVSGRPYTLVFRHLSYKERQLSGTADSLGDIVLEDAVTKLESAVVKGRIPVVRVEDGKLVYDAQHLAEGTAASNAFEAIAQLPNINGNDDQLSVMGAPSRTTVILNGKPSTMSKDQLIQFLKSTPVDRLERVEASYSAPASWHAVGAAINIVIKRDPDQLKGQLEAGYIVRNVGSQYITSNLYAAGKRLSADIMVNYSDFADEGSRMEQYRHNVQGTIHNINQASTNKNSVNQVTLYTSLGYKLKKESSSLNLSYYGDFIPSGHFSLIEESNVFGKGETQGRNRGQFHGTTFSFDSKRVSAGASYSFWDNRDNKNYWGAEDFSNRIGNIAHRANAYVDATQPLFKNWNLGFGGRAALVRTIYDQQSSTGTQSGSAQNEYDTSAYASLSRKFKTGISLSATLSGNYYTIADYNTFNLLPRLSFTLPVIDGHTLQFSGYAAQYKPTYSQQSNYHYYTDAYNISMGNPALRPRVLYNANLSYILKSRYNFSLIYQHVDKYVVSDGFMSPWQPMMITQPQNIDFSSDVLLKASIPVKATSWWRMNIDVMGDAQRYKASNWNGISFDLRQLAAQASLSNYFTISKQVVLSLEVGGLTKHQNTIHSVPARWYLDAAAQWTFAKERMVLSLRCNDILQTQTQQYRSTLPEQQQYFKSAVYRRFTASLTYKFGNYTGSRVRTQAMDASRAQ